MGGLKKIVYVLCGFSVVLVAALFGASIAAARLAKDTSIDPVTGIMYAKDSNTMMKTEQAKFHRAMNFALLSNKELDHLMEISMTKGDVKFEVKGYARTGDSAVDEVMFLVDGGTITFDPKGITDTTGDAERLLTFAYGNFTTEEDKYVVFVLWMTPLRELPVEMNRMGVRRSPFKKKEVCKPGTVLSPTSIAVCPRWWNFS